MAKGSFRNETRVVGMPELVRELAKWFPTNEIAGKLRQAAKYGAKPVLETAQAKIPRNKNKKSHYVPKWHYKPGTNTVDGYLVFTPFAADQVKDKSKTKKTKTGAWAAVGVHPDAFYATQFVEVGTNKGGPGGKLPGQDPQPWLEPSLVQNQGEIKTRMRKSVGNMVKRAANKVRKATRSAK